MDGAAIASFQEFFRHCVGDWLSERTYHYLPTESRPGEIERSRTTFRVDPITLDQKAKVLADNDYAPPPDLETLPGFQLGFHTVSETGEEVSQSLRMLFVPTVAETALLEGDYLRDRAYEEDRPILSHFRYTVASRELLMTTRYTKVISVDSITLVNPELRIRRILNYRRPEDPNAFLTTLLLAGFGVERKGVE